MVYVRVLGSGLIPRSNGGIAPKKDPFPVTLETIRIMLGQGTLIVELQNPYDTKEFIPVNSNNVLKLYKRYDGIKPGTPKFQTTTQVKASNPESRKVMVTTEQPKPVEPVKVEEKPKQNEQKHENKNTFKPVANPTEK